MITLLIFDYGNFHHKNKDGLHRILEYINNYTPVKINYKLGNENDIPTSDIIYSPCNPINTSLYPTNKKFIFGPHFSVFPDEKLSRINNTNNNCIYIQPSIPAMTVWQSATQYVPITWFPFPVNTYKFIPLTTAIPTAIPIFIYYKRRHPNELTILLKFLDNLKKLDARITYRIFDYIQRYNEDDYLAYIQTCKYGIILDAHESQGFAIQEAMSCNIPLLVWSVKTMSQEWNGYTYTYSGLEGQAKMVSIPYWDARCGEIFYDACELENTYIKFIENMEKNIYKPREFILETLSTPVCAMRFLTLCGLYP